jgi:hypothetical protein
MGQIHMPGWRWAMTVIYMARLFMAVSSIVIVVFLVVGQSSVLVLQLFITVYPKNQTNNAGASVTFLVSATSLTPMSFQWQKNGTNLVDGGNISGSTTNTLTITGISDSDAAVYSIIISNAYGSATNYSTLTVIDQPVITAQPSNLVVLPGTNVAFGVSLTGSAPFIRYQWQFNGTNILNAKNATYAISSVATNNAGNYAVVITNLAGSAMSSNATLTVVLSPKSQTNYASSTATFTATAFSPESLNYQWQKNGTNLVNGGKFSGVTTNTLTITSVSSNEVAIYSVTVTNLAGSSISSNATLTVIDPPIITAQPLGQRLLMGSGVLFNVAVSGTAPFNYHWRFNGANILNATNATYAIQAIGTNNTGNYSVVVTNLAGSVTSSNALLTVIVPPTLALQLLAGYPLLNLYGRLSNNFVVQYNANLGGHQLDKSAFPDQFVGQPVSVP